MTRRSRAPGERHTNLLQTTHYNGVVSNTTEPLIYSVLEGAGWKYYEFHKAEFKLVDCGSASGIVDQRRTEPAHLQLDRLLRQTAFAG